MSLSSRTNPGFIGLVAANTILATAMPMLIILGGLAGLELASSPTLVTLPPAVQMLAGLLATAPFAGLMGRYGRRTGFMVGGTCAVIGGVLCALAMLQSSFILLCLGHMALGAALACYQYFRFAVAEVVTKEWQPVAISIMLTSGLVAAFSGPELFIWSRNSIEAAPLSGAYVSISVFSLIGMLPLLMVKSSRPSIGDTAQPLRLENKLNAIARGPILGAIVIGAVSQGIMVLLMSPTPLAMIGCGFSEDTAGDVIRWHVIAMFAPSFVTGFLIKKYGTRTIAILGLLLTLISAGLAASGLSLMHFYGSLIILGIGWNFSIIASTNLIVEAASDAEKAFVQGTNNTVIALISTLFAFGSGAIVAHLGWTILAIAAIPVLVISLAYAALIRFEEAPANEGELPT